MSFDINPPTPPKGIQEAQNMRNNGGGGNLGYFQRGKKKKNKKDEIDVFSASPSEDEFFREEVQEETENSSFLERVSEKFTKFFKNQSTF